MKDCLDEFCLRFEKGGIVEAIRQFLPKPGSSYDQLSSEHQLLPFLVNYIDACVFGTHTQSFIASQALANAYSSYPDLVAKYPKMISRLNFDLQLLSIAIQDPSAVNVSLHKLLKEFLLSESNMALLTNQQMQELLDMVVESYRGQLKKQIDMSQGLIIFRKKKAKLGTMFLHLLQASRPWYAYCYSIDTLKIHYDPSHIPVVFLEPVENDLSSLLSPLKSRPAIFIFKTYALFCQMLQFQAALESLCEPNHLIYILEIYPNEQFSVQNLSFFSGDFVLSPYFLTDDKETKDVLPSLLSTLGSCLRQSLHELQGTTAMGDELYTIAQGVQRLGFEKRLGVTRAPALMEYFCSIDSHDRYKKSQSFHKDLKINALDLMMHNCELLASKRVPRAKKIKIAYIVSQIIDAGDLPSFLLENFIVLRDPSRFEVVVVSTEARQYHPLEYPTLPIFELPSEEAGKTRILSFKNLNIEVMIQSSLLKYEDQAKDIAKLLHHFGIDIMVCLNADAVQVMTANLCDVPLRVFLGGATAPAYPGFDLIILDSSEEARACQSKSKVEVLALPGDFTIDKRDDAVWATYVSDFENLITDRLKKMMLPKIDFF